MRNKCHIKTQGPTPLRRVAPLLVPILFLASCFNFNNPYENGIPATQFQIVLASPQYGGTYIWNPQDSAYETTVGGTPYYVYMDSEGFWCLAAALGETHYSPPIDYSSTIHLTLPPTNASGWHTASVLTSVDDSAGGVSVQGSPPSQAPVVGNTLQVAFVISNASDEVTFQWQSSATQEGSSLPLSDTGSTYVIQSFDSTHWISVVITPMDSTGTVKGTPVTSQSVYVP